MVSCNSQRNIQATTDAIATSQDSGSSDVASKKGRRSMGVNAIAAESSDLDDKSRKRTRLSTALGNLPDNSIKPSLAARDSSTHNDDEKENIPPPAPRRLSGGKSAPLKEVSKSESSSSVKDRPHPPNSLEKHDPSAEVTAAIHNRTEAAVHMPPPAPVAQLADKQLTNSKLVPASQKYENNSKKLEPVAKAAGSQGALQHIIPNVSTATVPFHMPNPRAHRILPIRTKGTDPAKCLDRIDDMYEHFYEQERLFMARPYMDQQHDINRRMLLVDWLVDVHHRLQLQPLTLWLTINILDRYLMCTQTLRTKLQLVGLASMFIACKYEENEEVFPPFLLDCVRSTDDSFKKEDILAMEKQILGALNYDIFVPTGYHFLTRYLQSMNAGESLRHLSAYYAERNLQEYDSIYHEPHRMAATAIFAAMCQQTQSINATNLNRTLSFSSSRMTPLTENEMISIWNPLAIETGFTAKALIPYARVMIKHVSEEPETAQKRRLSACRRKFASVKYLNVSALPLPAILPIPETQTGKK